MKNTFYTLIFLVLLTSSAKAQCPNGDAEQGNFINWATIHTFYGDYLNSGTSPAPANKIMVIPQNVTDPSPPMLTSGIDTYGGFTVPSQGTYAFRLGDNLTQKDQDAMWYKFTVTPANAHFKFRYAIVLNDGRHSASDQPYFSWFMNVATLKPYPHIPTPSGFGGGGPTGNNQINRLDWLLFQQTANRFVANTANPFFKVSKITSNFGDPVVYKNWQCVEYDLTPYMGKQVLIYFRVNDCSQGGHFGYAYIDGLCDAWPATASFTLNTNQICSSSAPLMMDGAASTGEDRYFIEIAEATNSTGIINPTNVVSGWTLGQTAGLINLSQWYQQHGGTWKCNTYYRVKLAVMNDCALWNEQTKMIYYYCPQVNAGPDKSVCVNNNLTTVGLATGSPTLQYSWAGNNIISGFNASIASVQPTQTSVYTLTVTDANKCEAKDMATVFLDQPIKTTISNIRSSAVCNPSSTLSVVPIPNATYYWMPGGQTTSSITVNPSTTTNYSVTVQNACGAQMLTTTVVPVLGLTGNFPPLDYTTWMGGIYYFLIDNLALPPLAPNAYNANQYKLMIFDRWGSQIYDYTSPVYNLVNEDIKWYGYANMSTNYSWNQVLFGNKHNTHAGSYVPIAVYVFRLELKNCSHQNLTTVMTNSFVVAGGPARLSNPTADTGRHVSNAPNPELLMVPQADEIITYVDTEKQLLTIGFSVKKDAEYLLRITNTKGDIIKEKLLPTVKEIQLFQLADFKKGKYIITFLDKKSGKKTTKKIII